MIVHHGQPHSTERCEHTETINLAVRDGTIVAPYRGENVLNEMATMGGVRQCVLEPLLSSLDIESEFTEQEISSLAALVGALEFPVPLYYRSGGNKRDADRRSPALIKIVGGRSSQSSCAETRLRKIACMVGRVRRSTKEKDLKRVFESDEPDTEDVLGFDSDVQNWRKVAAYRSFARYVPMTNDDGSITNVLCGMGKNCQLPYTPSRVKDWRPVLQVGEYGDGVATISVNVAAPGLSMRYDQPSVRQWLHDNTPYEGDDGRVFPKSEYPHVLDFCMPAPLVAYCKKHGIRVPIVGPPSSFKRLLCTSLPLGRGLCFSSFVGEDLSLESVVDYVPAPRLVCVEENPGPKTAAQKARRAAARSAKTASSSGWVDVTNRPAKVPVRAPLIAPVPRPKKAKVVPPKNYGEELGAVLGRGAHMLGTRIFGSGDYFTDMDNLKMDEFPMFTKNGATKGGVMVVHKEYIGDIVSSTSFNLSSYVLQPGLSTTFPWLSQIAPAFEEYIIHSLVAIMRSESSDAVLSTAANSALGFVGGAIAYDVLDPNFANKKELLNYEFAVSRKPSESFIIPMECAREQTPLHELFTRSGDVPSGADARLYDAGNLQIVTQGQQSSGGTLHELWLCYAIEFLKPKFVEPTINVGLLADHWTSGSGPTNALPLTNMAVTTNSNLGLSLVGGNTLIFPSSVFSGQWLCTCVWRGASATALTNAVPLTFVNAAAGPAVWINGTLSEVDNHATTTSQAQMQFTFTASAPSPSFTFGSTGTLPTSVTAADIIVTQLPIAPWNVIHKTEVDLSDLMLRIRDLELSRSLSERDIVACYRSSKL